MAIEIIELEIPEDLAAIHCMVCGSMICGHTKEDMETQCKHVLFLHSDEFNEFLYVAPELQKAAAEADADTSGFAGREQVEYVLDRIDVPKQPSILCIAATSYGHCCGPTSSTLSNCKSINVRCG